MEADKNNKSIQKMQQLNKTVKPEFQIVYDPATDTPKRFVSTCVHCKAKVRFVAPTLDYVCPDCGQKNSSPTIVLVAIILAIIFGIVLWLFLNTI